MNPQPLRVWLDFYGACRLEMLSAVGAAKDGLVGVVHELVIWTWNYGRISTSLEMLIGYHLRLGLAGEERRAWSAFQCMRG